jgi:hypothetical protein
MAAVLKSTWQSKTLLLDMEGITSREYKVIKRHTGLRMGEFEKSFSAVATDGIDAEVVDCLLWLFLKRDGQDTDPETLEDYKMAEFLTTISQVPEAESSEDDSPKV